MLMIMAKSCTNSRDDCHQSYIFFSEIKAKNMKEPGN